MPRPPRQRNAGGRRAQSTGHSISGHEIQHGHELHRYWTHTELETACPSSLKGHLTSLGPGYLIHKIGLKLTCISGWRDDLVVKSTECSSRGPRFVSQHPQGGSQLSVTPVPSGPKPCSSLCGTHTCGTNTFMWGNTRIHKNKTISSHSTYLPKCF